MPKASSRLSPKVCSYIEKEIREAGGNEVFVVGNLNAEGIVVEAFAAARGHESAVPVIQAAADRAEVLIHNHPSGVLRPSDADLAVASRAAASGLGSYIVNNSVTEVYVIAEPVLTEKKKPIDPARAAFFLSQKGPLAELSRDYEARPSQMELASSITTAFNDGKVASLEAGTGVGKSFAYLIPAALWSVENKDRVVVSTATINLQQQLIEKDIPRVRKIIGNDFKAVLVKGRGNYLCRRRFRATLRDGDFFAEDEGTLKQIADWAATTSDGSRSDLPFMPPELLWSRINSESDACMGMRCMYHAECFVMKARKEAAGASIIVVNHHLLFADIEARYSGSGYEGTAVLPPFHMIVFDEAHAIENAATSFFSGSTSRFSILRQLNHFAPDRKRKGVARLDLLEGLTSDKEAAQTACAAIPKAKKALEELEEAALATCDNGFTFRVSRKTAGLSSAKSVFSAAKTLWKSLASFCNAMHSVFEGIDEEDADAAWESKIAVRRLESSNSLLEGFVSWDKDESSVFWIERSSFVQSRGGKGKGGGKDEPQVVFYPKLNRTPLAVAETMKDAVFDPFRTVVCVSATLRVGKTFDFWMARCGVSLIEKKRLLSGVYDSPFPYETNVLLALPESIPLPDEQGFQAATERLIPDLISASRGSALVLFTSYESMRNACRTARALLASSGFRILCQGEDDRARLLHSFRAEESSVLFATDSFWEGIDAPGDTLRHVIIAKLPFRPPNNPVFEARCERIEERGGNSFMELSVPDAVIKFRQGFGRLMRKKSDRGVVTVLDRRITARRYGKIFLESIPKTRIARGQSDEVLRTIKSFLYNEK